MKRVRQHVWAGSYCIYCGALTFPRLQRYMEELHKPVPLTDERQCIEREDHVNSGKLAPEPARRVLACEDVDVISTRLRELRAEAVKTRPPDEPAPDVALGYVDRMIALSEASVG